MGVAQQALPCECIAENCNRCVSQPALEAATDGDGFVRACLFFFGSSCDSITCGDSIAYASGEPSVLSRITAGAARFLACFGGCADGGESSNEKGSLAAAAAAAAEGLGAAARFLAFFGGCRDGGESSSKKTSLAAAAAAAAAEGRGAAARGTAVEERGSALGIAG